jgi:beta-lactamase class A
MDARIQAVTHGAPEPKHDAALDAFIAESLEVAGLGAGASAYVSDLRTWRYGHWRSREVVYPASVIKVPIMTEVFHRYAQGTLRPHDPVMVSAENQTATAGPAPFTPGYRATVQELVEFMIVYSDNVATNQLMDVLGRHSVTEYMRELGLSTFLLGRKLSGSEPLIEDPEMVGRNRLPALGIGRLLELIAVDAVPGAQEQRAILARCADDKKLVPGLAGGDVFMHKTGETDCQSHDAGILFTSSGGRYVIVLYCEVEPKADHSDASWVNPAMTAWMRALRERL